MPLPTTFAGVSSRGEGGFLGSYGYPPIGGPYFAHGIHDNESADYTLANSVGAIAVDDYGNIYYGSSGNDNNANSCPVITKLNSSGVVQWTVYLNLAFYGLLGQIKFLKFGPTNTIYVAGIYFIAKLNCSDGSVAWSKQPVSTTSYVGTDVDSSGNLFFAAYETSTVDNGNYCTVYKFNSSGTLVATTSTGNAAFTRYTDLKIDSNGKIYLVGQSNSVPYIGVLSNDLSTTLYEQTLFQNGAQTAFSQPTKIAFDSSNNVYLISANANSTASFNGYELGKFGSIPTTTVYWTYSVYGNQTNKAPNNPIMAITVDKFGTCFAVGPLGTDANGAGFLWSVSSGGTNNGFKYITGVVYGNTTLNSGALHSVTTDNTGNVYMGGSVSNGRYSIGSKSSSYDVTGILLKDYNAIQTTTTSSGFALNIASPGAFGSTTVTYNSSAGWPGGSDDFTYPVVRSLSSYANPATYTPGTYFPLYSGKANSVSDLGLVAYNASNNNQAPNATGVGFGLNTGY